MDFRLQGNLSLFPKSSFLIPILAIFGFQYFVDSNLKATEVAQKERNHTFHHFSMENSFVLFGFVFFLVGISNYAINKQATHFCSRVARKTMRSLITRFSFPSRLSRGSWKARRARGASRAPSLFLSQKAMTAIPFFA